MEALNNIYNSVHDYCKEIPKNTPIQMCYAAGAAFILETIISGKPNQGVVSASLSALATAIHGLVSPLFKKLTGGRTELTWGEEMCRSFVAIIGAGMIAKSFGNNSILDKLTFLAVLYSFITYVDDKRRDLDSADWIPIFPRFTPAA